MGNTVSDWNRETNFKGILRAIFIHLVYYSLGIVYLIFGGMEIDSIIRDSIIRDSTNECSDTQKRHFIVLGSFNLFFGILMCVFSFYTRQLIKLLWDYIHDNHDMSFSVNMNFPFIFYLFGPGFLLRIWTVVMYILYQTDDCFPDLWKQEVNLFYYHSAWISIPLIWTTACFHLMKSA